MGISGKYTGYTWFTDQNGDVYRVWYNVNEPHSPMYYELFRKNSDVFWIKKVNS